MLCVEFQRGSALQFRVERHELPWVMDMYGINPKGPKGVATELLGMQVC